MTGVDGEQDSLNFVFPQHPTVLERLEQRSQYRFVPILRYYTKLDSLKRLVTGNAYYVNETIARDPEAFTNLSQGQSPQVLWVGCADSRVPETTVCHCKPGDIFVHRNIANKIHADDRNSASVVEYAVKYLKVEKIVVCEHTKCGGAIASLTDADLGETLNKWLQPLRE